MWSSTSPTTAVYKFFRIVANSSASGGSIVLAVAEMHQPAEPDQRGHKAAKQIEPVLHPLSVTLLGHDSHHDRSEQGEQDRRLEMRQTYLWHQLFFPTAISYASTIASTLSNPAETRNLVP